jgi:hypothetical protein
MSKTVLSSLSSLMPAKGEAARPEVMPEKGANPVRDYQMPAEEARDGLTIRILKSDNKRLKAASYHEGRTKQSLLDQAIGEFLSRIGY